MSRSFGKVLVRVWADPDWRALDVEAQHLYVLLLSQPVTNLAGVVPVQPRRWASCAAGWKPELVEAAMDRLVAAGFIVVDWETEELLIRSFIRNDEAYKIPGPLKAILAVAEDTQSTRLRETLAGELARLPALTGKTAAGGMAAIEHTRRALGGGDLPPGGGPGHGIPGAAGDDIPGTTPEPIPDAIAEPIPDAMQQTILDGIPDAMADGIGDGSGSGSGSVSRSSSVGYNSLSSAEADTSAKGKGPRTQATGDDGFDRFYAAYPRHDAKPDALKAWRAATKRTPASKIMEGLARFRFDPDPQYIPQPGKWLRHERWNDEPTPPGARHLVALAASDGEPALSKAQMDDILGPDPYQAPAPPPDIVDDPRASQAWQRKQFEAHRAQRVQAALARLGQGRAQ